MLAFSTPSSGARRCFAIGKERLSMTFLLILCHPACPPCHPERSEGSPPTSMSPCPPSSLCHPERSGESPVFKMRCLLSACFAIGKERLSMTSLRICCHPAYPRLAPLDGVPVARISSHIHVTLLVASCLPQSTHILINLVYPE
jgi:hypothetical protein